MNIRNNQINSEKKSYFATFTHNYENVVRSLKILPHYRYIAHPLYIKLGGKNYPLFSVPTVFFAMDYLFHQVPANLIHLYTTPQPSLTDKNFYKTFFKIDLRFSLFCTVASLPIAIHKHLKNQPYSKNSNSG